MDFRVHPRTQGLEHPLMPRNRQQASELGTDDDGFEMLAVASHLDVFAFQAGLDPLLDVLGGNHLNILKKLVA